MACYDINQRCTFFNYLKYSKRHDSMAFAELGWVNFYASILKKYLLTLFEYFKSQNLICKSNILLK